MAGEEIMCEGMIYIGFYLGRVEGSLKTRSGEEMGGLKEYSEDRGDK